jgi:hypothetical protein
MPRKGSEKSAKRTSKRIFRASDQAEIFEKSVEEEVKEQRQRKVECLGITFENDEARREYFLRKLAEKLKDPEFRKIEGFPIGSDEDILALSDPPYYTACPNPFLEGFARQYGEAYDATNDGYRREPFAADVNEGKADPIYNAHSYHTKVPHKAIMRYILHYTNPGDVVLDGFCGTGMTGVAAQLCGDKEEVAALGYNVGSGGVLLDSTDHEAGKLGGRVAVLNDLAPAATLITAGYNLTRMARRFARQAAKLLDQFEEQYGWMHQTIDSKTKKPCPINFTVWSEIFACPDCAGEIEFWSAAYDDKSGNVSGEMRCPHCRAEIGKRDLQRKMETWFDPALRRTRKRQALRPILINYTSNGVRRQKKPDDHDLRVLEQAEKLIPNLAYPTDLIMFVEEAKEWGDLWRGYHQGIQHVHDFYLPRQLVTASVLWQMGNSLPDGEMRRLWRFTMQSVMVSFTRRNRFLKNAFSQVNRGLSGTLYIGSTVSEPSPRYVFSGKIRRFPGAVPQLTSPTATTTQSLSSLGIPSASVDYAFLDPPFGDNLPYAELNFLWEAWLRVFTNARQDAIVSGQQKKDMLAYTALMTACLKEVYRVLKPGRWVTVEFHNSKNAVWNAIQEALGQAGFIIADVRVLDKGMLTKKQLNANAVNKDLVISAYKPDGGLENRFKLEAGSAEGVWDFVRTHMRQLPVFVSKDEEAEVIAERQNYLLYDRMLAFHVQRGVMVPLSASEFYEGLAQRFSERDGMYFLPEQAAEYDRKRMTVKKTRQLDLFVRDESSAIQWLQRLLKEKPQTFQEIHPQFMREIAGWEQFEKPLELKELLDENFLCYDGEGEVPDQIHAYLSSNFHDLRNLSCDAPALRSKARDRWYVADTKKAADLEQLRDRALLKEFWEYLPVGYTPTPAESSQAFLPGMKPKPEPVSAGRRLKVIRLEAVRAGFKYCWQNRDYRTIIAVAQRIPENVLQEDPKLLMWYDQALTRTGQET